MNFLLLSSSFRQKMTRSLILTAFCLVNLCGNCQAKDDFAKSVLPVIKAKCFSCHGGDDVNGEIDFNDIESGKELIGEPAMIKEILDVIEGGDMPPENEPQLTVEEKKSIQDVLKASLKAAAKLRKPNPAKLHRLNRFQYNNSVRDLFRLNREVFPLTEKLMTRHDNYLQSSKGKMPLRIRASSNSNRPKPGLKNVRPFPKDLRAAHGFDNQANQLSLSPLLLDSFFKLSVSIIESPDFNENTVGIWKEFFAEPDANADRQTEVSTRLKRFLRIAFRRPVDEATVRRYTEYAIAKIDSGLSFSDAMKKVASATLSSPNFLYRVSSGERSESKSELEFDLASRLSYFLWGSCPDERLLKLAEEGKLSQPDVLNQELDRMLADARVERFLDSFPAQWMQLENLFAATPDPAINRFFHLDKTHPASRQMVVEPLLLFDSVFVENRPVVDLISPDFSYRSPFLQTWYESELKPEQVDRTQVEQRNRKNLELKKQVETELDRAKTSVTKMVQPVRDAILESRKQKGRLKPVDLKPYAAWEFDDSLDCSVGSLNLTAKGKISYEDGKVVLNNSFLQSPRLPIEIQEKTFEVWLELDNLDQRGGGAMGLQDGALFDSIVIGERQPKHWIAGSNNFARTEDFPGSFPESANNQLIQLVLVFSKEKGTTFYRNGKPYGKPFQKGLATFKKDRASILFGLRHLPAGGNRYLKTKIDRARFYNRALSHAEVAEAYAGDGLFVSQKDLADAMTSAQVTEWNRLKKEIADLQKRLEGIPPPHDPNRLQQEANRRYDDLIRSQLRETTYTRTPVENPRYGGVITNAAVLSMTSGPKRTHPIARGAWIIEVIFNDPPPPPPNDVPPLNEEAGDKNLTIRERFKAHRANPDCAGCHSRLDPLGFALENFDITGRWREKYPNGRDVDSTGKLIRKYEYSDVSEFKKALVNEEYRFAKAFTSHLLRFGLGRELEPTDTVTVEAIVDECKNDQYRFRALLKSVLQSELFINE